ncbi:MAG: TPM domain-containing protein [Candidatus Omnitrophica bacterium]|nr:TPM domain-containing protein [Candidatus Omnitrophota bacterium]
MRKFFYLLVFLFVPAFAFAQDFPKPVGWVNDYANVINEPYKSKLENLIQEVEEKTSSEIGVVTVNSIAPLDEKEYARQIFDSWKPGKKGKDNGVLVLLAIKERRWRIETGYGVEGFLPDGLCGEIGRNYMVPYFKTGNYSEGLYYGVNAIATEIANEAKISLAGVEKKGARKQSDSVPFFFYIFLPVFFAVWNLPWPIFIGLPFTLFFAFIFFSFSPVAGILIILGYVCSMLFRYFYWNKLPASKKGSYWGPQSYGGTYSGGSWSSGGGFGGGGGGGGFGGGGGGGGGAGGGF